MAVPRVSFPLRPSWLRPSSRWSVAVRIGLVALALSPEPMAAAETESSRVVARNWLVEDGLPNDSLNRCVRDARGFLWLATASGIARFDGREFKEYPLPEVSPDLSANVRDLAVEDENTLVMLPASGGVLRLSGQKFSVHPVASALTDHVLMDLFTEGNGILWIGTVAGELVRWQEGKVEIFGRAAGITRRGNRFSFARDGQGRTWVAAADFLGYYDKGRLIQFPEKIGSGVFIAPSPSGDVWVSTTEHLLKLRNGHARVVRDAPEWRTVESGGVQALCEDDNGALWIGTRRQGLFRLSDGPAVPMPSPHKIVRTLLADAEQNLWVGTDGGGLSRIRAQVFQKVDASAGLPDNVSSSVCEDSAGALWSANRSGGVVRVLDGQLTRVATPTGDAPFAIAVCPDLKGNVWVGTTDALYRTPIHGAMALQLVSREQRNAHVLFGASNGDVWIGYADNRLGFFRGDVFLPVTQAQGHTGRRIKAIAEDSHHRVWVATDDRQIFEYVDGRLVRRVTREQLRGGLILGLYFDAADNLWIATVRGLVLKQNDRLRLFTTEQGLVDDEIAQVLEDDRGRLWCSSRRGFFCMVKADLLAIADGRLQRAIASTLGRTEGLHGASALNTTQPLAWRGRGGRLWFATHAGIVGIDSRAALAESALPRVFIDEAVVDRQPVAITSPLRLAAARMREVEFKIIALNYAAPEAVRVRHQLVGFDFDWVETGSDGRASYARLPPGDYTLRVSASTLDGRGETANASLQVVVNPAWWQTRWSQGAGVLAFTGLIILAARYWSHRRLKAKLERLEREHALEKERARIARDLHDDLGGSLTQIGMLADRLNRQVEPMEIKRSLHHLAGRTRTLAGELESIVWTVSPKNNTWDRLASFIAQFAQRFFWESGIECSIEGVEHIPALHLTPDAQHHVLAVVKEALNNVLKHSRATAVKLTMTFRGGIFELRLVDNGVGFDPAAGEHAERNGLANMKTRAAEIGGEFAIDSRDGKGTGISLRIPLAAATTKSS